MRNARGWLVAFAILATAVLIWNLGLQRQLADEHAARRHSERAARAERRRLASGLAEANRRLVQLGGPPVVIAAPPTTPSPTGGTTPTTTKPAVATTTSTTTARTCPAVPVLRTLPGVPCSG